MDIYFHPNLLYMEVPRYLHSFNLIHPLPRPQRDIHGDWFRVHVSTEAVIDDDGECFPIFAFWLELLDALISGRLVLQTTYEPTSPVVGRSDDSSDTRIVKEYCCMPTKRRNAISLFGAMRLFSGAHFIQKQYRNDWQGSVRVRRLLLVHRGTVAIFSAFDLGDRVCSVAPVNVNCESFQSMSILG